jgi:hypothetical protein
MSFLTSVPVNEGFGSVSNFLDNRIRTSTIKIPETWWIPECMRLDIDPDDGVGPELADGKLELLPGVHVQQFSRLHTGRPDGGTGTQNNHK